MAFSLMQKHKASVLSTAIETLEALRNEVTELNKKIKQQEQDLSQPNSSTGELASQIMSSIEATNNEGVHVQISEGSGPSSSSSSERTLELQVAIKEDACNVTDMVTRLLECLKQMNNVVSVISIEARTQLRHSQSFSLASIRLVIKVSICISSCQSLICLDARQYLISYVYMLTIDNMDVQMLRFLYDHQIVLICYKHSLTNINYNHLRCGVSLKKCNLFTIKNVNYHRKSLIVDVIGVTCIIYSLC